MSFNNFGIPILLINGMCKPYGQLRNYDCSNAIIYLLLLMFTWSMFVYPIIYHLLENERKSRDIQEKEILSNQMYELEDLSNDKNQEKPSPTLMVQNSNNEKDLSSSNTILHIIWVLMASIVENRVVQFLC